jgi:glycerophosphoryl diester phosphodiesterase
MCHFHHGAKLYDKRSNAPAGLSCRRAWTGLIAALALSGAMNVSAFADEPPQGVVGSATPRVGSRVAKKIVVIAHRGAHREAPENTLASLAKAIEIGCDFVEIDVRRTKDGALVIMHDSSINRMTNGKGKIEDLTLAQIRSFEVKSRHGARWAGQKVPTFDEILDRAKGRMKIYVDHKQAPPAEVLAAINKHGMLHDVVVYGGIATLREYKKLAPAVWIMPGHPRSISAIEALAHDLKPETLDGSIVEWTQSQVEAAHRSGAQVWVDNRSDLDNEPGIKRAVELGVDAIQTDDPATVLRILKAMGRRGEGGK